MSGFDVEAVRQRIEYAKKRGWVEGVYLDRSAALDEITRLKSEFDENQRERFARYAEEHAKVLGLEAEVARLREERAAFNDAGIPLVPESLLHAAEAERDALRVRLGSATELLTEIDDDRHANLLLSMEARICAFLADGAP